MGNQFLRADLGVGWWATAGKIHTTLWVSRQDPS
jgi:hypothetical protein